MKRLVFFALLFAITILAGCGFLSKKTKLDIDELIEIEVDGFNGYSNVSARLATDYIYEEFSSKHSAKSKNYSKYLDKTRIAIQSINIELSKDKNLSNGDKIIATITYDSDKFKEAKISILGNEKSYVVEGLPEIRPINPFDYLDIRFDGISPTGKVEMNIRSNDVVSLYRFSASKDHNLKNGDSIIITYKDTSDPAQTGYVITETKREYEIVGLDSYLEKTDDLSSADFDALKSEFKDTLIAYRASKYKNTVSCGEPQYLGMIIFDGGKAAAFYKATLSSQDNSFSERVIYYPIICDELIIKDNKLASYNIQGVTGESLSLKGIEYSRGYLDPYFMYTDIVESQRNEVCYEDKAITAYAERPIIESINDIPESYIDTLLNDSEDYVKSHILKGREKMDSLEYLGYYFLISKNQSNDASQNNKLYFIYKATLTDTSTLSNKGTYSVYYISGYYGIMAIDNSYVYTDRKTDIGKKSLLYGRYYYESLDDAYSDLVLSNSDKYTYEVSESFK